MYRHIISFLILIFIASAPLAALELLSNGDMSQGQGVPIHWDHVWQPEGSTRAQAHRDTDIFSSAPASLRFDNPEGVLYANVSRVIQVRPEKVLTISAQIRRSDAISAAVLGFQGKNADGSDIWIEIAAARDGATGWQRASTSFRVPVGVREMTVVLLSHGSGSAWLDDVSILEAQ